MRWPDSVGDSGAAVCGSSGGGVSVCPSIFATLAKMTSSLNPPCCHLFVAVPTPAASTLSVCCCSDASRQPGCAVDIVRWPDTVGDSGAAVCDSSGCGVTVCPSIFATLAKNDIQPQPSLFAAAPTPAGSRSVRLTLCDGPTLSETRGRPFVAPRAAVLRLTKASVFFCYVFQA